jgi:hypothetical protein
MTMVFKSGTKQFHASAWEFLRNEDLDANTYFRNASGVANPLNRLNTYGFNVEGPVFIPKVYNVKKEKTFFFYNMEWRKALTGGALNTTVPLTSHTAATWVHGHPRSQRQPALGPDRPFLRRVDPGGHSPTTHSIAAGCQRPTPVEPRHLPRPTSGNKFVGGNNAPTNVREELFRIDHHFTGSSGCSDLGRRVHYPLTDVHVEQRRSDGEQYLGNPSLAASSRHPVRSAPRSE